MDTQQATPLSGDDYRALLGMLTSSDQDTRVQGQSLATKLTPDEQQVFFAVQQQANKGKGEVTRTDNSVLGLPPEMAAVSGLSLARAVGAPAANIGARVIAGAKNVVAQSTPLLKYEATKTTLEHFGVPTPLAMATAIAVSGYRGNGKHAPVPAAAEAAPATADAAATSAAPSVAPPESVPAAAAQTAAPAPPAAPPVSPGLPTLKLSDLTAAEKQVLQEYVDKGMSKADVLQGIAEHRASQPALAPATVPQTQSLAPPKPTLKAAELPELQRLLKSGKSLKDSMELIEQQRDLAQRLGLPSATQARAAVLDRNASGRWPQ